MKKKLYRFEVAYDGRGYSGWQSQASGKTIQDELERAFSIATRDDIKVQGASRTDAGVHSEGQTAIVALSESLDLVKTEVSVNALLPVAVKISPIVLAKPGFHPIVHSLGKAYRYRIFLGKKPSPFLNPYCWAVRDSLDIEKLAQALQVVVGKHNFRSFCAADSSVKSYERTIFEVVLVQSGPLVDIWISGDGFLKQMVRSLVGTAAQIALGTLANSMEAILDSQDRKCAGVTAPAQGLSLVKIFYDSQIAISDLIAEARSGFTLSL